MLITTTVPISEVQHYSNPAFAWLAMTMVFGALGSYAVFRYWEKNLTMACIFGLLLQILFTVFFLEEFDFPKKMGHVDTGQTTGVVIGCSLLAMILSGITGYTRKTQPNKIERTEYEVKQITLTIFLIYCICLALFIGVIKNMVPLKLAVVMVGLPIMVQYFLMKYNVQDAYLVRPVCMFFTGVACLYLASNMIPTLSLLGEGRLQQSIFQILDIMSVGYLITEEMRIIYKANYLNEPIKTGFKYR